MKKKATIAVVAFALVLCFAIGGTLAWLSDESETVTNTFTVGDIDITLTETTGEDYKIIPGGKEGKNPKVTVEATSEKCYVYVLVDNTVRINDTVVATPNIDTNNWIEVSKSGTKTLYRYNEIVDASTAAQERFVFTEVTYADTITKDNIDALNDTTIVITAYAHQSENTTQDAADAAAIAWAGLNTNP